MIKHFIFFLLIFIYSTSINAQIDNFQDNNIVIDRWIMSNLSSCSASDIDNDGDIDILATRLDSNGAGVVWFENMDGLGNYSERKVITEDVVLARHVYAADIDGDGDMDVISASSNDNKIAWYENLDGNGTFGTQQIIANNFTGARRVFAADLDGDLDMDILATGTNTSSFGVFAWYENVDGQGTFELAQVLVNSVGAKGIAVADVDGDDDLDLFYTKDSNNGRVSWFENIDGLGSFGSPQLIKFNQTGGFSSVFPADIDGDGDIDVAYTYSNNVGWSENIDGLGDFAIDHLISETVNASNAVVAVDVDGDGDYDIGATSESNNEVMWFENLDGNGDFDLANVFMNKADNAQFLLALDIDFDGDQDFVSASLDDRKLVWYNNTDGNGTYSSPISISKNIIGLTSITNGDIDGDGDIDIISTSTSDDEISWYPNLNGEGDFRYEHIISNNEGNGVPIKTIPIDFDNDGDLDIITLYSAEIVWFENLNGLGDFSFAINLISNVFNMNTLHLVDIDNDGDNDLIGSDSDDKLMWFENEDGMGNFGSEQIINNYLDISNTIPADVDNDGFIDILFTRYSQPSTDDILFWVRNIDGTGAFGAGGLITDNSIRDPGNIEVGDIDNDGDIDVVVGSTFYNRLSIFENLDGIGNFGTQIDIDVSNTASGDDFKIIDFNNNGKLDIIYDGTSGIAWAQNIDGQGTFGNDMLISEASAKIVEVSDFDNDGVIDVVSANTIANTFMRWHKNLSDFLSIEDSNLVTNTNAIQIYPNPVVDFLMVDIDNTLLLEKVEIYSILGRKINTINSSIIDLSELTSGLYILKVYTDQGTFISKFIKD